MKQDNKSLIDLCSDVIKKNELFSKMIADKDKEIKKLQNMLKEKHIETKELNNTILEMAYKVNQKVELYA